MTPDTGCSSDGQAAKPRRRTWTTLAAATVLALTLPATAANATWRAQPATATTVTAVGAAALSASTPRPIVGETVIYRAKLATTGVRPVTLQLRTSRGWTVVAKGTTTAKGDARLAHAASKKIGPLSYRLVASRAVVGRRTLPAVTTATATVSAVAQTSHLEAPGKTAVGAVATFVLRATPARPGRAVVLQELRNDGWVTVSRAAQDRNGRALLTVTRQAGHRPLRGLVLAAGGAPSRATNQWLWPPPGTVARLDIGAVPDATVYDWRNWSSPDRVSYSTDTAGNFVVNSRPASGSHLRIDTFDPRTYSRVGTSRTVSVAGWSQWGGMYSAPDGHHYVLLGNLNEAENDAVDLVAVRRYDAGWNLVGTATIKGGDSQAIKGIWEPFGAAAPHMVLAGDRLVVHMGRGMYRTNDGARHQSNFTFEVDTASMTARSFQSLGGQWKTPYASHSFAQFAAMHGSSLVLVDHGDAYPRSIFMHVFSNYPSNREPVGHELMKINGSIGDNNTGTSVTGMVSGPDGVVVVGNSIAHEPGARFDANQHRNVYAIAADPTTGSHQQRWLTTFSLQTWSRSRASSRWATIASRSCSASNGAGCAVPSTDSSTPVPPPWPPPASGGCISRPGPSPTPSAPRSCGPAAPPTPMRRPSSTSSTSPTL